MQYQTFNAHKTPLQGSFFNRALLAIIAIFVLFSGLLLSAFFLAFSMILAPVIGLRLWWLKRRYQNKVMSNHAECYSHPNPLKGAVIEAEYTVLDDDRSQ